VQSISSNGITQNQNEGFSYTHFELVAGRRYPENHCLELKRVGEESVELLVQMVKAMQRSGVNRLYEVRTREILKHKVLPVVKPQLVCCMINLKSGHYAVLH
jgi:hypothetical protein